jgi:uncharacterized protein (TIGR03437 family)
VLLAQTEAAWNLIGGSDNAGTGVKIAILDTGIDQTHPTFQDSTLTVPDGYPKCNDALLECAYTSNKVIAARSYVKYLVGSNPLYTRPDDLSARDRVGHGTAVATLAAGAEVQGPIASTGGVAPKAWLGNYKIFGSPGVNDITFYDALYTALEDAYMDGMDIIVLAVGSPALWGANDEGANCGYDDGYYCDWRIDVLQQWVAYADKLGLTVVAAGGDSGDTSYQAAHAVGSIQTPGTWPGAITVGSVTNAHEFYGTVTFNDEVYAIMFARGYQLDSALTLPLRAVRGLGEDDGTACTALPEASLSGAIALVQLGQCDVTTQVNHAQKAGARAVLLYQYDGYDGIDRIGGVQSTGIPIAMIGNTRGSAFRTYLETNPDTPVTLDPEPVEVATDYTGAYTYISHFSSFGPATGTNEIKPDVVAPGEGLYVGTQSYDPNGELYSANGYTVAQGSSFAAGIVAGVAALVKQQRPEMTPAQVKSAVVNTANSYIADTDGYYIYLADVISAGAGIVDAEWALKTNLTVEPVSLSFAPATSDARTLTLTNHSSSSMTVNLNVTPYPYTEDLAGITISPSSLTLPANSSGTVSVKLAKKPESGLYEGWIDVTGGTVQLEIPYLYITPSGTTADLLPLYGDGFAFDANGELLRTAVAVRVIDSWGLPVEGVPVTFKALDGGQITSHSAATDYLGIADAGVVLGPDPGLQRFMASAAGMTVTFTGRARTLMTIDTDGVVNAGSGEAGAVPGSLVAINGVGLSETSRTHTTTYLPPSLAGVSVSFDIPDQNISLPGRLSSVTESQLIVQVPWELAGQTSVKVKASIGDSTSQVVDVPLVEYSPAAFEITDPAGNRIIEAQHLADSSAVTTPSAAVVGETVLLSATGLGAVDNTPASGEPAAADPVATVATPVTVTIGGMPAEVLSQTLMPGAVGRYQLQVRIGAGTPGGLQPVVISMNGLSSKPANLPIR